ncbi:MAG: hypothetical protein ABJ387_03460 [Balneola sp.]
MPEIGGSDLVTIVAFEFGGSKYLFEVGGYNVDDIPEYKTWVSASRKNNATLDSLHLLFTFKAGYLDQQLNAGTTHTLADDTVEASATAIGVIDLLNALIDNNSNAVYFYPALEDGDGNNSQTKYEVVPEGNSNRLLNAVSAGRFTPSMPIKFKTKNPLDEYPSWLNR